MKSYGIGVDIGGTTVKIGVFESDGTLVKTWEIPTRTEDEGRGAGMRTEERGCPLPDGNQGH